MLKLTTKAGLAKHIGISLPTFYKNCEIAMCHEDFEGDYPLDENELPNAKAPLTDYQAWFLIKLAALVATKMYSRKSIEMHFIQETGVYQNFRKDTFNIETGRNAEQNSENQSPSTPKGELPLLEAEFADY